MPHNGDSLGNFLFFLVFLSWVATPSDTAPAEAHNDGHEEASDGGKDEEEVSQEQDEEDSLNLGQDDDGEEEELINHGQADDDSLDLG